MVTRITMEPVSPGFSSRLDLRHRTIAERAQSAGSGKATHVLPDSDADEPIGDPEDFARSSQHDRSADFAVAVIAAVLPSAPQSVEDLMRRIGTGEVPEQSQARLRDLLV